MRHSFLIVGLVGALVGCAEAPASRLQVSAVPVATQCATVMGSQLGALPLEVEVAGHTVRFTEWTMADEAASDFIGFAASVPGSVQFTVRAGERTFSGTGSRWLHPAGFAGPRVRGIDAVTFCTSTPAVSPVIAAR